PSFREDAIRMAIDEINRMRPDVVVVTGDLTAAGYEWEFAQAAEWLGRIEVPKVVVPGNHDSRNVGYVHFERFFGDRFSRYRQAVRSDLDIDIILAGHKHVPFFWGLNGILVCNSSTAATRRVRGLTPLSWNELQIDASTVKVYLHYEDGRRELSVIFSRKT